MFGWEAGRKKKIVVKRGLYRMWDQLDKQHTRVHIHYYGMPCSSLALSMTYPRGHGLGCEDERCHSITDIAISYRLMRIFRINQIFALFLSSIYD
jgi:hypothetical protein